MTAVSKNPIRLLINPIQDSELFKEIVAILDAAVAQYPETYEHVQGSPSQIPYYGYHDSLRSCVILSDEDRSLYKRLTIRPIFDSTHEKLRALVREMVGA